MITSNSCTIIVLPCYREILTKEAWRSGRMRFSKHPSDVRAIDDEEALKLCVCVVGNQIFNRAELTKSYS